MSPRAVWTSLFILWAGTVGAADPSEWMNRPLQVRELGDGWIEVEGEAQVVNITPEEARRRALQDARERAIMFAVGVDVQAQSLLLEEDGAGRGHEAFFALSEQASAGRIVEERSAKWESFEIPGKPLAITLYRARLQVKVAKEEGRSDPDFKVKIATNKERFVAGEEMRLAITASKKCYVSVLNLTAVDTVVVLLPHQYRQDCLVVPGDTLWIPDADEQAMGIHYRVMLPAGRESAVEMIKVVATKEAYAFGQGLEKVSIYNQVPTRQTALVELMRWLVQIPRDQRTEAQIVYEVRKK